MSPQDQLYAEPKRAVCGHLDPPERIELLRAFGSNLSSLRADAGLSQPGLAARSFLRHDYISAFECGVRLPSVPVLLVLADALGQPPSKLLDGVPAPMRRALIARALALMETHPGINTPGLAEALDLSERYVTQLTRRLEAMNTITAGGQGWKRTKR